MLKPEIIDKLKKERRKREEQPRLDLPLPFPPTQDRIQSEDGTGKKTSVIIIDMA